MYARISADDGDVVTFEVSLADHGESMQAASSMAAVFESVLGRRDLRALVVHWSPPSVPESFAHAPEIAELCANLFAKIERAGHPVIGAIGRPVFELDFELALACHVRVAARSDSELFGFPGLLQGRPLRAGGTQRLPRLIGIIPTLRVFAGVLKLTTQEAVALGLIAAAVEPESLLAQANAYARSEIPSSPPWESKGYVIPDGVGLDSTALQSAFSMATCAALARADGRRESAELSALASVFEGTQAPFAQGLALERKHARMLGKSQQSRR